MSVPCCITVVEQCRLTITAFSAHSIRDMSSRRATGSKRGQRKSITSLCLRSSVASLALIGGPPIHSDCINAPGFQFPGHLRAVITGRPFFFRQQKAAPISEGGLGLQAI
jgi:hypothetical protein